MRSACGIHVRDAVSARRGGSWEACTIRTRGRGGQSQGASMKQPASALRHPCSGEGCMKRSSHDLKREAGGSRRIAPTKGGVRHRKRAGLMLSLIHI